MTTDSTTSRRDSWPPTQVRLERQSSKEHRPPLAEEIDQDPLTYFLTPSIEEDPNDEFDSEDEDDDAFLDAGIEDPTRPSEPVRCVSPSTLGGALRDCPSSPEMDTASEEEGDEHENTTPTKSRYYSPPPSAHPRWPAPDTSVSASSSMFLLRPPRSPPQHGYVLRGRPGLRDRSVSAPTPVAGRRPSHLRLWREPSPDVWSIEEEDEEEGQAGQEQDERQGRKRVRFVLPAR